MGACHADYASKQASTSIACWNSWLLLLLLQSMLVLYPLFHELLEHLLFVRVVVTSGSTCIPPILLSRAVGNIYGLLIHAL